MGNSLLNKYKDEEDYLKYSQKCKSNQSGNKNCKSSTFSLWNSNQERPIKLTA